MFQAWNRHLGWISPEWLKPGAVVTRRHVDNKEASVLLVVKHEYQDVFTCLILSGKGLFEPEGVARNYSFGVSTVETKPL